MVKQKATHFNSFHTHTATEQLSGTQRSGVVEGAAQACVREVTNEWCTNLLAAAGNSFQPQPRQRLRKLGQAQERRGASGKGVCPGGGNNRKNTLTEQSINRLCILNFS
jgi:hypothetical protein